MSTADDMKEPHLDAARELVRRIGPPQPESEIEIGELIADVRGIRLHRHASAAAGLGYLLVVPGREPLVLDMWEVADLAGVLSGTMLRDLIHVFGKVAGIEPGGDGTR